MRRKDREVTDIKEIESFLRECRTCRLALSDGEQPYIVPVNFGYCEKKVYIHGAKKGKKLDIIRKNNRVCLEWDKEGPITEDGEKGCNWSMDFFSVIAQGTARILEDPMEKHQAMEVLMEQFSGRKGWAYNPKMMDVTTLIEVNLYEISGKKKG